MALALIGCGTKPLKDVVTKVDLIPVEIPAVLLKKCKATAPIPPDDFIIMTSEMKEIALTDLNIKLYTDIKNCNEQLEGISKYQAKQTEIIKGQPK